MKTLGDGSKLSAALKNGMQSIQSLPRLISFEKTIDLREKSEPDRFEEQRFYDPMKLLAHECNLSFC